MKVKKIKNALFHNANKLNGEKSRATYGIFRGEEQVGIVLGSGLWEAWNLDATERLIGFSCSSLKQLKECLANK